MSGNSEKTQERQSLIAALQRSVRAAEGGLSLGAGGPAVCSLGDPGLDVLLPGGGLSRGRLHEVGPAAHGDGPAVSGFAAALAARLAGVRGQLLWVAAEHHDFGRLYGPGLAAYGLDPGRLIIATARGPDLLWAIEEGLKCQGLSAVVGELPTPLGLTPARRLQLAAQASGVTGVLLALKVGPAVPVAITRWVLASAPQEEGRDELVGVGGIGGFMPRWRAHLTRARGEAADRHFRLSWDPAFGGLTAAPPALAAAPLWAEGPGGIARAS